MPASITVHINGLEKLQSLANRFPKVSQLYIDQAIVRSIGEIDIQTKPNTPVKTGRLRNSFIPIFRPFSGKYGTRVPYAQRVHDLYPAGSPYKRPSLNKNAIAGFLTVGVRDAEPKINQVFEYALDQIVKALAK